MILGQKPILMNGCVEQVGLTVGNTAVTPTKSTPTSSTLAHWLLFQMARLRRTSVVNIRAKRLCDLLGRFFVCFPQSVCVLQVLLQELYRSHSEVKLTGTTGCLFNMAC